MDKIKNNIRVLIIDDFQISALGTKALLQGSPIFSEIFTAFSVDEALSLLESYPIDIVLCDILMPEKDGFEAFFEIKSKYPQTKIMYLSISEEKDVLYKVFAQGADGYQFKDITKDELINSILIVLNGKKYFNPRIIDLLFNEFSEYALKKIKLSSEQSQNNIEMSSSNRKGSGKVEENNLESISSLLTKRELEIMKLIGNEVPTKEIARLLNISSYTVSTHRKNIYVKLGIEKLTDLKKLAKKIGNL